MWVQFEPADVRVAINVSLREICVVQNLSTNFNSDKFAAPSDGVLARQSDYVLAHLKVSAGNNLLSGVLVKFIRPPSIGELEQTFFQYELVFPFTGPPPAEVTFENDMLKGLPYAIGTPWNVSYVIRAKRAGDDSATTWLLGYEQPATIPTGFENSSLAVSQTPKSQGWRTFCEYLRHGIMHILTGWDHLLFVSALVLATRSFLEMVKVIAAFTMAHTPYAGVMRLRHFPTACLRCRAGDCVEHRLRGAGKSVLAATRPFAHPAGGGVRVWAGSWTRFCRRLARCDGRIARHRHLDCAGRFQSRGRNRPSGSGAAVVRSAGLEPSQNV